MILIEITRFGPDVKIYFFTSLLLRYPFNKILIKLIVFIFSSYNDKCCANYYEVNGVCTGNKQNYHYRLNQFR